jgi:chitinase
MTITSRSAASVIALVTCVATVSPSRAAAGQWVSGYYVGYGASAYPPSAIDFSSLTHVMVFSVLPRTDGTLDTTLFIDATNGPKVAQQVAQLAHAAGRKAILTVGGAGTGSGFEGASGSQNMATFVNNIVAVVNGWGFDGVDVDWEPLPTSDYNAFLSLVSNLRSAKPGMTLTAAVGWQSMNFPLSSTDSAFYSRLASSVDQMNMMTYGMADNWGGWVSWHSSALFGQAANHPSDVSSSAQIYINAGVPAAKIGMGIGAYGSCWNSPTNAPLESLGSSSVVASDNDLGFAHIMDWYYNSAAYRYDATAEAPYLSFATATGPKGCTFVSYEDETSVHAKGNYSQQIGLGGTIVWQLNEAYNPGAADPNSLLHAIGAAFLGTATQAPSVAPADTTPPTVSITAPANNSVLPRKSLITISVSASDNTAVSHVNVYVNGVLKCSTTASPYSCQYRLPNSRNATVTIGAKAYDPSNNVGTAASVVVKVQ